MRCLLDSNILLRLSQPADPFHVAVRRALLRLRQQGAELVVVPQNLAEFWNVSTRPAAARGGYGQSIAETDRQLGLLLRRFTLLEELPGTTRRWRRLLVTQGILGVAVHDARLVAAMQAHQVTHILTLNDKDFARYSGIVALNPQNV